MCIYVKWCFLHTLYALQFTYHLGVYHILCILYVGMYIHFCSTYGTLFFTKLCIYAVYIYRYTNKIVNVRRVAWLSLIHIHIQIREPSNENICILIYTFQMLAINNNFNFNFKHNFELLILYITVIIIVIWIFSKDHKDAIQINNLNILIKLFLCVNIFSLFVCALSRKELIVVGTINLSKINQNNVFVTLSLYVNFKI